jgi:hypothetical protein
MAGARARELGFESFRESTKLGELVVLHRAQDVQIHARGLQCRHLHESIA